MKALYIALSCAVFLGIALSLQMTVFKSSENPQIKFDFRKYLFNGIEIPAIEPIFDFGEYHFNQGEISDIEPIFVLEEHFHPTLGRIYFFVGPKGKAKNIKSSEFCKPFAKGKQIKEIPFGVLGQGLLYIE